MNKINRNFFQNTEIRSHVGLHLLCHRFPVTKPYICKLSGSCCREVLVWNPLPYIMRLKLRELLLFVHIYLFIAFVSVQWMVYNIDCRFEWDRLLPTVNSDKLDKSSSPISSVLASQAMKVQTTGPSEISVNIYQSMRRQSTRIFQCSSSFHFFSVDTISHLLSSPLLRLLLILVYVYRATDESERHTK